MRYNDAMQRGLWAALVLSAALAAPARAASLPGLRLRMNNGFTGPALNTCSMKRCLTIYVSPGCHFCVAAAGLFKQLRDALRFKGVATRIVVGDGSSRDLQRFASVFGSDTLLDPDKKLFVRALPTLWLSDKKGSVLRSRQGAPEDLDEGVAWALAP
jgi:hypothetical protein